MGPLLTGEMALTADCRYSVGFPAQIGPCCALVDEQPVIETYNASLLAPTGRSAVRQLGGWQAPTSAPLLWWLSEDHD